MLVLSLARKKTNRKYIPFTTASLDPGEPETYEFSEMRNE